MTGLTRWDPFAEIARFQNEVSRLFDDSWMERKEAPARFAPLVDVFENEDGITLSAELAGVKPEEVEVHLEDGRLTISGERKMERDEEKGSYRRVERSYGAFSRSFSLPRDVDLENIRAEHKDGVLEVFLPRRAEARPRKIAVKAH